MTEVKIDWNYIWEEFEVKVIIDGKYQPTKSQYTQNYEEAKRMKEAMLNELTDITSYYPQQMKGEPLCEEKMNTFLNMRIINSVKK